MRTKEHLNFTVTASENKSVKKLAKSVGLQLPSPSFAVFKSVYAKIEEANKNGVRLARKTVKEALPTLIGTQVNLNHWRKNYIVGNIFWAGLNENDEIEIAFTFFKSVYPEEYEKAIEQFEDGELTVSFELSADKESQVYHADGTRTLNDFYFDGVGLLLDENPAYPGAIVFESAKLQMENIINEANLIFAKQHIESPAYTTLIASLKTILKGENSKMKLDTNQANDEGRNEEMADEKKNDVLDKAEDQKPVETSEEEKKEDVKKEEVETKEDDKVEVKEEPKEEASEEEPKEDSKEDEVAEEATEEKDEASENSEESEDAKTTYETEQKKTTVETYDQDKTTVEVENEVTQTVTDSEGNKSVRTLKEDVKETFTFAEVDAIKADYEQQIATLKEALETKNDEIKVAKETATQVERLRAELGDYVNDFTDEDFANPDKIQIARLTKERDALKSKSEADESEDASDEAPEDSKDESKETETASTQDDNEDLETGHEETTNDESPRPLVQAVRASLNKEK